MIQPPLSFLRPSSPEKRVSELIAALDGKGWKRRRVLERELGWSERLIRDVANASRGQIIGTNKGYCVIWDAAVKDCDKAEARLLSQIRVMVRRVRDIRNARNRRTA